ncbi:MAG: phosphoglycerate kinase [Nitrososphaerales archaeon]|jgi:phosphoglycerate kinase
MNYSERIREHKLVNLSSQLKGPTLVRIDINLPFENGAIAQDAMRMKIYANIAELYASYVPLVLIAHQGRKGDEDFSSLKPHYKLLLKLTDKVDIDFIEYENIFTESTRQKILQLKPGSILLLDNVRYFDHETKFNPSDSPYIKWFKGVIQTCVNDAIPVWHRDNSSLMCLPYIAPTRIGVRSSFELNELEEVKTSKKSRALVSGGSKLQKISDLKKIFDSGVNGFTGGLVGQLVARANGYDLGESNNEYLERKFSAGEFEDAKKILAMKVKHPVDFTVVSDGEKRSIDLKDMPKQKGQIVDIGDATVDAYARDLQAHEIRIRAGPLGIYEKGYYNGIELTKRIAGDGLYFLGGDTSQELIEGRLQDHIESAGGKILISGGAALHYLADGSFPSVDELVKMS